MSKYTTGEVARLCKVSVRTVQYYDSRKLLVPSELSEGGRRLYSEDDLKKMKIICFLREVGFSINSIGELFSEEDPGSVISLMLEQQEMALHKELQEKQTQLSMLEQIKRGLKDMERFSVESIGDIARIMESRKKLYRVRAIMLSFGLLAELVEAGTLLLGIFKGIWWPFVLGLPFVIGISIWISVFYFKKVDYICPQCHHVFKPGFKEALFANHTPTTRKLRCPNCGHKGFCVETYSEQAEAQTE